MGLSTARKPIEGQTGFCAAVSQGADRPRAFAFQVLLSVFFNPVFPVPCHDSQSFSNAAQCVTRQSEAASHVAYQRRPRRRQELDLPGPQKWSNDQSALANAIKISSSSCSGHFGGGHRKHAVAADCAGLNFADWPPPVRSFSGQTNGKGSPCFRNAVIRLVLGPSDSGHVCCACLSHAP
jgi:hypothetical protein